MKDVEKYKFLTECWKPPREYAFPSKVEGKQTRKFNKEWLNNHNWLAYSAKLSGGLCKYCVLFAPPAGAGVGNQVIAICIIHIEWKFAQSCITLHQNTFFNLVMNKVKLHNHQCALFFFNFYVKVNCSQVMRNKVNYFLKWKYWVIHENAH